MSDIRRPQNVLNVLSISMLPRYVTVLFRTLPGPKKTRFPQTVPGYSCHQLKTSPANGHCLGAPGGRGAGGAAGAWVMPCAGSTGESCTCQKSAPSATWNLRELVATSAYPGSRGSGTSQLGDTSNSPVNFRHPMQNSSIGAFSAL
jgi:hypothetical protein